MSEVASKEDMEAATGVLFVVSTLLDSVDWEAISRTIAKAHALGPIVIPTEYREGAERLDRNERVVNATKAYLRELKQIHSEKPD